MTRNLCICPTNSSHESKSTSTNFTPSSSNEACKKTAAVVLSSPNLLFMYMSALRPFMADNRPLPTAITRFVYSTIIGFLLGRLTLAVKASSTSPIPAANVLLEWRRSAMDSLCECTGESLDDMTRMLDVCEWVDVGDIDITARTRIASLLAGRLDHAADLYISLSSFNLGRIIYSPPDLCCMCLRLFAEISTWTVLADMHKSDV